MTPFDSSTAMPQDASARSSGVSDELSPSITELFAIVPVAPRQMKIPLVPPLIDPKPTTELELIAAFVPAPRALIPKRSKDWTLLSWKVTPAVAVGALSTHMPEPLPQPAVV